MKKSKTTLANGEGISKVLTVTSQGNVYEATPEEVGDVQTPAAVIGALSTNFTLEGNSNPAFTLNNRGAAELYQSQMGGYMFLVKSGTIYAAKLNGGNWNRFADGTPVSDASKFETMVHVPDCHYKGEGKHLNFGGPVPIDGGHVFGSPHWVGAYQMYVDAAGKGHSRPDVAPTHSKTMTTFWGHAQNLGTEFGLANYGFHCLINALYQARYGNLNSQKTIGPGFQTVTDGLGWEALRDVPMGLLRSLGDGSGKVLYKDAHGDKQYPVKLFGFEDLWGKLWEFCPGIRFYMEGSTRIALVYNGNIVSNTITKNDAAFDHMFECAVQSAGGEYVRSMECGEFWDMIAQSVSGAGSDTYYCDGYWAATAGELLVFGGGAKYGARCGLSYANSHPGFSISWTYSGARLAFYGEPKIVSGAELEALAAS